MATANPATLMRYNAGGLGSSVVDASGKIVRHAGFLPVEVAGAFPVVAPLMAMQALSTIIMLQQFSAMDKKLDAIKLAIDTVLARQEATKVAELFTAVQIVDEIYAQYGQTGHFSTDMLIRLALAEHNTLSLSRRYEMLESSAANDTTANSFDNYDTYCVMLASFLHLRVKHLRTCVDIQENPQFVQRSSESFAALLKANIALWDRLLSKSEKMKENIDEIEAQLDGAKGIQKFIQAPRGKELSRKKEAYNAVVANERTIMKDFLVLIDSAKQISDKANTQEPPAILFWRDGEGEHCIATKEDLRVAA
jgi:hypothetical protein